MASLEGERYFDIQSDSLSCNLGESIHISQKDIPQTPTVQLTTPVFLYEDGIQITSFSSFDIFIAVGYDYTPTTSGEHDIFLATDGSTSEGYVNSNILTITVVGGVLLCR